MNDRPASTAPAGRILPRRRIAVVGAGIAGLGAAWLLRRCHDVTLFEKDARLGGHSHTVDARFPDGRSIAVDTGFIVYNQRNYPNLTALFAALDVASRASDMSFSVSIGNGQLEWAGDSLMKLFGQPANLVRPRFHRMLRDILRFNRDARAALRHGGLGAISLGRFLAAQGYDPAFASDYLLPMGAAIWSAPPAAMLDVPAESFLRFFANHGLLDLRDRPVWRTVDGGSRHYVDRLAASLGPAVHIRRAVRLVSRNAYGVTVIDRHGEREHFDHLVLACHADQAADLLSDADPAEAACLRSIRFQANEVVLHGDPALMPRRRRLWASWNYLADRTAGQDRASVSYWMNRLQGIDRRYPLFVTLNPTRQPDPAQTFGSFCYDHPMFDAAARAAQARLPSIQGHRHTWYCGSWTGNGFHEDGLASAIAVALSLGVAPPWHSDVVPAATGLPQPATAAADLARVTGTGTGDRRNAGAG